jgi:selenide,water dikinase
VLTKALGTGVISTAIKRGEAKQEWVDAATKSMTTLNRAAAEIALKYDVHAMTDITGFGLIGHAREMALGSGVGIEFEASKVPVLTGALECIRAGFIPGGLKNNREFAECLVEYDAGIPEELRTLIFDPQTAGGLLVSVASRADEMVAELKSAELPAAVVGRVLEEKKPAIRVRS